MTKYISNEKTVVANNYQEAAEKIFGQEWYKNPANNGEICTTYVDRHIGYAIARVYKVGDKQGSFWGVQVATPQVYEIKRA